MTSEQIINALQWRYAVKTFDGAKKVSDADLTTILESGRLSASSFGVEPWKFLVIKNPEVRIKLRAAAYDQTKVTDAAELIVIAQRTDVEALPQELVERMAKTQGKTVEELQGFQQYVNGAIAGMNPDQKESWARAQTYIALGSMIETASLLQVDNCPMEGFNKQQVNEILGLTEKNLSAVTMLAIGYRGDDAYASLPKTRRCTEEVIEII